jgi:hypothetical protein
MICDVSFICWFSMMFLITCIRELREKPDRRAVAVITGWAMVAIGLLAQAASFSIATVFAATGRHNAVLDAVEFGNRLSW